MCSGPALWWHNLHVVVFTGLMGIFCSILEERRARLLLTMRKQLVDVMSLLPSSASRPLRTGSEIVAE